MTTKPTASQTLAYIPEFKTAQDRLVELQLKLIDAQKRFGEANSDIAHYDDVTGGPTGGMQRVPGQVGKFAPPPQTGSRVLKGNAADTVGEKARALTTSPSNIDVPSRVSREKLVEQLEAIRTEMRILERAVQMQQKIVDTAGAKGSAILLKAAIPAYKQHVLAYLTALEALEAAEVRMRDYLSAFRDQPYITGVDAFLPQPTSTGLGRFNESQSKINRIFSDARDFGVTTDRKVA